MKILLTGSNGLLGRCFVRELTEKGYDYTCGGHSDLSNSAVRLDITDYSNIESLLQSDNYTHIINCAADRDPESCLNEPSRAYRINAAGVENLTRAANKFSIQLCHISTDYVFDGTNPPYSEDAVTFPVNVYGRSKLAGELAARSAEKHLVLRIPALYRTDIADTRNLVHKLNNDLSDGKAIHLDNTASRFYTQADEVAKACIILLEQQQNGIVHLSGEERTTKAEFARIFAESAGYDTRLIHDINNPAPATEKRPEDSQLDTSYFKSLSDFRFSGPTEAFSSV